MNKKAVITVFLIISIFIISACDSKQSQIASKNTNLEYKTIEETLKFLTDDECNGRLIGTDGNLLTQKFLVNSLNSFGLEKLNATFNDEFQYNQLAIKEINLEILKKKFVFGKDFFVNKISNADIRYPIELETNITNDCIVLIEDYNNMEEFLANDKVKGILMKTDSAFMMFTPAESRISNKTMLYVTKDTYEYLKENIGTSLHLQSSYTLTEKSDNNIVGMIKGNNAKKAVVLSAHFDHLGGVGKQIFRGAIDNASGTAALLEVAKNVYQAFKKENLNMDIIFAFFNAEEVGKSGSKNFADKIQSKYGNENIININIDCIGSIDDTNINICYSRNNLQEISRKLTDKLNEKSITNIKESLKDSIGASDNVWFDNNIYIYMSSDNIHTLEDTISNVDVNLIENISDSITNLILNFPDNIEQEVASKQSSNADALKRKFISDEANKLKSFEYKFMDIDGKIEFIGKSKINDPYDEVNKYFNNELDIIPIKLLDEVIYNNLLINFNYAKNDEYSAQQLNTIYKRNYRYQDISTFELFARKNLYDSANIKVKNEFQNILLAVIKVAYSSKEQESIIKFYKNNFGSDTFDYKGYKLYYKYAEDRGEIKCISKDSNDQCMYFYSITDNTIKSFDKDKIIKLLEDYDMFSTLEAIEIFMAKPGETSYENGQ